MGNNGFVLSKEKGYFNLAGVDINAFDDIYPAGHQSGVSILMHGKRIATNGDLRFEQTPGQWQPLPKQGKREISEENGLIVTHLSYPDMDNHLKGFNPMLYPDYAFEYTVSVKSEGRSVRISVDLSKPVPKEYLGKMCFNLELFPAALFGKPWIMDDECGIFPPQPNGPTLSLPSNYDHTGTLNPCDGITADRNHLSGDNQAYSPIIADDIIAHPYAVGRKFTLCPDDVFSRLTVESLVSDIKLYDGRMNHNNGWFVLSSEIPEATTKNAVEWIVSPGIAEDWLYTPVIQVSQVGYMPKQQKIAVIELDARDNTEKEISLFRITEQGAKPVLTKRGAFWGKFLRYHYLKFDFSEIETEGLYRIECEDSRTEIFRIAQNVFERGVWQPVLEYFLPVQMCHMRVNEKYRVWHGLCHNDDARMAPVNYNHIDGYVQGSDTLTKYKSGDSVPGLNAGGWHDAGDFDLRIESQAGEMYILSLAHEAFGVDYDATTIDQARKVTEIHQPDGKTTFSSKSNTARFPLSAVTRLSEGCTAALSAMT